MKVRHIRRRRLQRAKAIVRREYGARCSEYDPYCITCAAHKFLRVHLRVPSEDELFNSVRYAY